MEEIIKRHLFETEEVFKENVAFELGCLSRDVHIEKTIQYNPETDSTELHYIVSVPRGETAIHTVKVGVAV